MSPEVSIANSDAQITACFPVMKLLRAGLEEDTFISHIRRQMRQGYQLAYICDDDDTVVAVAGFRFGESLAWGKYVYVDDLVTAANRRSKGYGGQLLEWIRTTAKARGAGELHLDTGVGRKDAHRFYASQRMTAAALHFTQHI